MKSPFMEQFMKRGQIYILPTKMGGYFIGLIFLMFLLSVGYSNNLILIFTLFLFGLNLLWVIQTHYHLKHLEFNHLYMEDTHAGMPAPFVITWKKTPQGQMDWDLTLVSQNERIKMRLQNNTDGEIIWNKRGVYPWRYLLIASERPFGLYRAWRYVKLEGESHVYPALSSMLLTSPLKALGLIGESPTLEKGTGDYQELTPYAGEEARKISWKHYARIGDLLIKEGEDEKSPMARFKWTSSEEDKLSYLATQMVLCYRQNIPFTFEMGAKKRGPEISKKHLNQCLTDLSLC